MILFRQTDRRFPFLWEDASQPPQRWHGAGEGPVQYLADTPDGAWAELLRHEEITDPEDAATLRRALWAVEVEIGSRELVEPQLPARALLGGRETYERCRGEAKRLRERGARGVRAPSAALRPGTARGWRVEGGVRPAADRDGEVVVLFGVRPEAVGWLVVAEGHPPVEVLPNVRHFA